MTTTTDAKYLSVADKCRAALKAAGYKATQVTVKKPRGGSVYVTIRTMDVALDKIEEIVKRFEVVYRDHGPSQEIMTGGYSVYVEYDKAVIAPLVGEITAILSAATRGKDVQVGPHVAYWTPQFHQTETPDHNSVIHTETHLLNGRTMRASGLSSGAGQLADDLLCRGIKTLAAPAVAS